MRTTRLRLHSLVLLFSFLLLTRGAFAQVDPGPRGGPANAGGPLAGLSAAERGLFTDAQEVFAEVDSVSGGITGEDGSGLGPTFNAHSSAPSHAQPAGARARPQPRPGSAAPDNPP